MILSSFISQHNATQVAFEHQVFSFRPFSKEYLASSADGKHESLRKDKCIKHPAETKKNNKVSHIYI
jgi:hypothetical protein